MIKKLFLCVGLFIVNSSVGIHQQALYLTCGSHVSNHWNGLNVTWGNDSCFNPAATALLTNNVNAQLNAVAYANSLVGQIKNAGLADGFAKSWNERIFSKQYLCALLQRAKPGNGSCLDQVRILAELARFNTPSRELQACFNQVSAEFASKLFDSDGQIKAELNGGFLSFIGYDYDHAVAQFASHVDQWMELGGYIECAQDTLNNFNAASTNIAGANAFALKKDLQAFNALTDFCKAHKFEDAYAIVQANNHRFIDNHANNVFKLEYVDQFNKVYNSQGIEKKYLDLPYYKQYLKDLPASMFPSEQNVVLAQQYALKQDILSACNLTQLSPYTAQVVDTILELHAQGPQAVMDYCSTQLSADHSNPEMRATYWDLHNANGSLKFGKPNGQVASYKFSTNIHTAAHAQDRKLIAELGSLDISKFYIKNGVTQTLKYIERSLNGDKFAASYGSLAHKMGDALLQRGDSFVLGLPDFAIHLPDATQESIKDHVVKFVNDTLGDSQINLNNFAYNIEKLERVSDAYGQMVNGNKIEQAYLNYAVKQYPCDAALAMDTKSFRTETNLTEITYVCGHIEKYAAACFDRTHNGAKTSTLAYEVNPAMRVDLLREGKNPLTYEKQSGDQVFHVEANYELHNIRKHAEISRMDMHPALRNVLEFGARSTFAVRTYLNVQAYNKAFQTNVVAHCTFSNIERAIKVTGKLGFDTVVGAGEGVVQAASSFVHTVTHPIQTVKNLVNVGTKGVKFVSLLGRMGQASLTSPEEYNKVLAEFNQKVGPVFDAVSEAASKATWRDVVRETTAFICDAKITSSALNAVSKVASVAKQGANNALQRVMAASAKKVPQLEVAAIGVEEIGLKVAQSAEVCVLSEAREVAKQGTKVSGAVASGIENAEVKAAQVVEDGSLILSRDFAKTVNSLSAKYGKNNVEQALKILNLHENNFTKRSYAFDSLERVINDIKKINSSPRWESFKFDAAKGGMVDANSINEAIAGIACEEQGLLQAPLIRSSGLAEEFIDPLKQAWDVKTPPSFSPSGKKIFNEIEFIKSINAELLGKENIILNISLLDKNDLAKLYTRLASDLTKVDLQRIVIVHSYDSSLSKTSTELVTYLGKQWA